MSTLQLDVIGRTDETGGLDDFLKTNTDWLQMERTMVSRSKSYSEAIPHIENIVKYALECRIAMITLAKRINDLEKEVMNGKIADKVPERRAAPSR